MIATSGFLLECTKFVFGRSPGLRWKAYSAPSDPIAGLRGPTSKEREREGKGKGRRGQWKGRGRKGSISTPPSIPAYASGQRHDKPRKAIEILLANY